MAKGKLKRSSESKTAAKIRKAIGAGPNDPVEIVTPQFERPAGESGPQPALCNVEWFDRLKTITDAERQHLGMRRWGRPEEDEAHLAPGNPMLWLFPGEWYSAIPDGYPIVTISFRQERFKRKMTDNDIRFGCLPYGILVRDAS